MEVVWIYYGFCGAIAYFVVWISLFFPSASCIQNSGVVPTKHCRFYQGTPRLPSVVTLDQKGMGHTGSLGRTV